jgi:hypothetical protein
MGFENWKGEGPWQQILVLQVFLYAAFGLACAGVASGQWITYDAGHEGLLWGQDVLDNVFFVDRTAELNTTLALLIIGTVFTFVAAFMTHKIMSGWAKCNKKTLMIHNVIAAVGAWTMIIGCSVYTSYLNHGYAGSPNGIDSSVVVSHSTGFILAWLAATVGFVGSCGCALFTHKTKDSDFGGL